MAWIGLLSLLAALALFVALGIYLVAWPVPLEPRRWSPGRNPGYAGPFARNRELAGLARIDLQGRKGPEHIAFGPDGRLYTGVSSGEILRMDPDGRNLEVFARTKGRVLGLTFDRQGTLIAADAMRGLLAIDPDGKVRALVERAEGVPLLFANSVIVASNGVVYFTDSSRRFSADRWGSPMKASQLDILEQRATGRVLAYDPATGATRRIASGLSFANGVALSVDERFLFVNETGAYRIWRVPIEASGLDLSSGPSGGASVLIDELPGFPDNLMRGLPSANGQPRIWCGLVKPRNPALDKLADKPFLRKVAWRLPDALKPVPKDYGHLFAFDDRGEVVVSLQDPDAAFPEVTSGAEFGDRLYVAGLATKWIGWRPRPR